MDADQEVDEEDEDGEFALPAMDGTVDRGVRCLGREEAPKEEMHQGVCMFSRVDTVQSAGLRAGYRV